MRGYNVKIANTVFCIYSYYSGTLDRLRPYITGEPADYTVTVEPSDLEEEYAIQRRTRPEGFNDAYIHSFKPEFAVLHRKISHLMINHDMLLVHGSCVVADGGAYLFIAPSGVGKSTHTHHWLSLLGDRARIINDDKPMIYCRDGSATVYATPWGLSDAPAGDNAPLKAITVLRRGTQNSIREISGTELFIELFKSSVRGDTADEQKRISILQNRLIDAVKCYSMTCTADIDAAKISYRALTGNAF